MFDRNKLVHAVIWPKDKAAIAALIDADGVIQSQVQITAPTKGSEIAKMMPDGFVLDLDGCTVLSMSGAILVNTVAEFDTAVVTERAEITFEERMQRLERRETLREQRQAELERENEQLRQQLVTDAQDEPQPQTEVQPETAQAEAENEGVQDET